MNGCNSKNEFTFNRFWYISWLFRTVKYLLVKKDNVISQSYVQ